jgi:hypothetical protein
MLGGNGSGSGSARSILGGGNCFIATAAYGTPLADQVRILCRFRDEYLMKTALGRKAVEFYYKVSPPIARAVSKSWVLRRIIRLLLRPVVEMVKLAVG